jgi:hypothetical protein
MEMLLPISLADRKHKRMTRQEKYRSIPLNGLDVSMTNIRGDKKEEDKHQVEVNRAGDELCSHTERIDSLSISSARDVFSQTPSHLASLPSPLFGTSQRPREFHAKKVSFELRIGSPFLSNEDSSIN